MTEFTAEEKNIIYNDPNTETYLGIVFITEGGTNTLYDFIDPIDDADRIKLESLQFSEGILDSSRFEIGSYVLPQANIQISYTDKRYKGKLAKLYLCFHNESILENESPWERYMLLTVGYVTKDTFSDDRQFLNLTIDISQDTEQAINVWNSNYVDAHNFDVGTTADEYYEFTKWLYNCLHDNSHFELEMTDDYSIYSRFPDALRVDRPFLKVYADPKYLLMAKSKFNTSAENIYYYKNNLYLRDVIKSAGEYLGAHFQILKPKITKTQAESVAKADTKMPVSFVQIITDDKVSSYKSFELPYYINFRYDDTIATKYSSGVLIQNGDTIYYPAYNSSLRIDGDDTYQITDNIFMGSLDNDYNKQTDEGPVTAKEIYDTIGEYIKDYLCSTRISSWNYSTLDNQYVPFANCGECLELHLPSDEETDPATIVPIMNCTVSGINSMICNIQNTAVAEKE